MLLEMRLDNVMFRLGYGRTRKEARQIVRHKHVTVNGKPVDIPSYQVKVGDVVEFKGRTHYTSSTGARGTAAKPGRAKVTIVTAGAAHPYHLIAESGSGSTVYGWVNAADVAALDKIKVGSTVMLRKGAKDYNGGHLASFVYTRPHIVSELKGDRAVITFGGVVVAAVKTSDLTLA